MDKVNAPAFKDAHEYKADISLQPRISSDGGFPFAHACDLAYAPVKHFGLITSYHGNDNLKLTHNYGGLSNEPTVPENFNLHGSVLDAGIGGFINISRSGTLEIYAGYGAGNLQNKANGNVEPGSYSGNYHRYFIQLAYTEYMENAAIIVGFKCLYKKYDAFTASGQAEIDSPVIHEFRTDYNLFLQPYFEVQRGNRFFRFRMQTGYQMAIHSYS